MVKAARGCQIHPQPFAEVSGAQITLTEGLEFGHYGGPEHPKMQAETQLSNGLLIHEVMNP